MYTATRLPSIKPTLARKFDAVHRKTVARRRMIPIVCRQTPPSGFWCGGGLLSWALGDLCDQESIGLLPSCESSECEVRTGETKPSAATVARGPLIAAIGFCKIGFACRWWASGSLSLPHLFHGRLYDP